MTIPIGPMTVSEFYEFLDTIAAKDAEGNNG